ncbi:MAG: cell division ATP-binding protein FtsE [Clostridiales bacterium]|nr:cell division ATP-binding protein FtsE [Clostridiales bacterium]
MIIFNDVTKCFGDNSGLIDASVHINRGDFVFLVGPSGAGKTTFIRLILKEIEADSGQILLSGKDITKLHRREIPELRQKIGMVFQDFRLLEKKTVYENVAFAMEVIHKKKKDIRERVPYVLKLVDIEGKADRYPSELSAGEQQRVGIARAIVNQPRVLICDEPTGNLDPVTAMDIMTLIEQINIRGTTVLMVTHAKDIVDRMNKRVVAIDKGHIVRDAEGSYGFNQKESEEGFYDPNVGFNATVNIDGSAMGGKFVEDNSTFGIKPQDFEKSEKNNRDTTSIVDAYLNGGEDFCE